MYRIYVWTTQGIKLFVSEHATAALARFYMYAWIERGFFPIKNDGPEEIALPVASPSCAAAYFELEGGPAPPQTVSRQNTGELDIAA